MRRWLLVCIAAVVLLAGWRPAPKEPEGLALVRVLGVDGPGPVSLTAVCGGGDQEKEQSRGACGGADFREALEKLPWSGGRELSLTSVSYIIVGGDAALEDVLLSALRNEELGAAARVFRGPGVGAGAAGAAGGGGPHGGGGAGGAVQGRGESAPFDGVGGPLDAGRLGGMEGIG